MKDDSRSAETREVLTSMYRAVAAGDAAAFLASLSPDVAIHEPPFLPYGGVTSGLGNVPILFGKVAGAIDVTSVKLQSLVVDGQTGVAFLQARTANGSHSLELCERSRVQDGKVTELKIFFHDAGSLIG